MTELSLALMMSGCPLCLFVSTSHVQIMWFFGHSARNFMLHILCVTHPSIPSLSLLLPHFSLSSLVLNVFSKWGLLVNRNQIPFDACEGGQRGRVKQERFKLTFYYFLFNIVVHVQTSFSVYGLMWFCGWCTTMTSRTWVRKHFTSLESKNTDWTNSLTVIITCNSVLSKTTGIIEISRCTVSS